MSAIISRVLANGLHIEVETMGNPADPTVLLVMGLGMQLVAWPMEFCQELVDAGFHVVRFDNRDVGLSDKIQVRSHIGLPAATLRYLLHLPVPAPYRIDAMADDAIGVLDALGIPSAHLVGASLGGMIAQTVAARAPSRCRSLVSIMSSSGHRSLPRASLRVSRVLLSRPSGKASPERLTDYLVELFGAIGSPGFPTPPVRLRELMRASIDRGYYPPGTLRQMLAIIASGDRSSELESITAPTLVMHGDADPLVPLAHGVDSARKIHGARLEVIKGMGHDLAPGLVPRLAGSVITHLRANPGL